MVEFEERIAELVALMPQIGGFTVQQEWVKDVDDVNRYLALKSQPYPIIFFNSKKEKGDVVEDEEYDEITNDCKFILATKELDINLTNSQRLQSSYKNILNPMKKEFLSILKFSSISRLPEGYSLEKVPNYNKGLENASIHIWDTIVLDLKLTINNHCLK